jgi:hypothetical protein
VRSIAEKKTRMSLAREVAKSGVLAEESHGSKGLKPQLFGRNELFGQSP